MSPAPLPNHADGGCQDGACDEADSSAEEIAPDGIGCDNHSRGAEGGGKTHGPFVHAYRDLRNNQNKPEVEDRFISVKAPVDGRNNPLAFDEHDPGDFRVARLYRRPEIARAEEGQKYQSR